MKTSTKQLILDTLESFLQMKIGDHERQQLLTRIGFALRRNTDSEPDDLLSLLFIECAETQGAIDAKQLMRIVDRISKRLYRSKRNTHEFLPHDLPSTGTSKLQSAVLVATFVVLASDPGFGIASNESLELDHILDDLWQTFRCRSDPHLVVLLAARRRTIRLKVKIIATQVCVGYAGTFVDSIVQFYGTRDPFHRL